MWVLARYQRVFERRDSKILSASFLSLLSKNQELFTQETLNFIYYLHHTCSDPKEKHRNPTISHPQPQPSTSRSPSG